MSARLGAVAVAVAIFVSLFPARAATIEVLVRDEAGGPLPGQTVQVVAVVPGGQAPMRPVPFEQTGEGGRATFTPLKTGRYRVAIISASGGLVDPKNNPLDAAKTVTLTSESDRVTIDLVLRRGRPVVVRMVSTKACEEAAALSLQGERTGARVDVGLVEGVYSELALLPDRWRVHLSPPMGWTIVAAELDGAGWREGALELKPDAATTFLEWQIEAPCRIEGKVLVGNGGAAVGVQVEIEQGAPGPWTQAQEAAGWEVARHLKAVSDWRGEWALDLPDGLWRVRPLPHSGMTLEAKPELLEVELFAGGTARADFKVRGKDGGGSSEGDSNLFVNVAAPNGRPLFGAEVYVFRAGTSEEVAHRPLSLDAFPARPASLNLEAGSYTITGSYPGFLGGTLEVTNFEPSSEPRRETVRLREGATIRVRARGAKDAAVEGVRVRVEPQEGGQGRAETTDASGWVTFTALEAGVYRLTAELADGSSQRRALWEDDGRREQASSVALGDREQTERSLRVLPAATITGRLVCGDGLTLPAQTRARVVPGGVDVTASDAVAAALQHPLLARVISVNMDGSFEAGPLEPGSVRVMLQPVEFDRGTWALGTEDVKESAIMRIEEAAAADLGTIPIHCGPRASLRLDGEAPAIDLRLGVADVRGVLLEGFDPVTETARRRTQTRPLTIKRAVDRIEVVGLPEGTVELTVTLCSPAAPAPADGEDACALADGKRARPVTWTVRVPAILGKVSQSEVVWPWSEAAGSSPP